MDPTRKTLVFDNFGMTLRYICDDLGVNLGWLWDDFGMTLRRICDDFKGTLWWL